MLAAMTPPVRRVTEPSMDFPNLFDRYRPHETAWDELFASADEAHGHCRALVDYLGLFINLSQSHQSFVVNAACPDIRRACAFCYNWF